MEKQSKETDKEIEKEESKEQKENKETEESELEKEISEKEIKQEQFEKFFSPQEFHAPVLEKIAETTPENPTLKWSSEISPEKTEKQEKRNYELLEEKTKQEYQTSQERISNPTPAPITPRENIDMQNIGRGPVQVGNEFKLTEPQELRQTSSAENYEMINPGSIETQNLGRDREKLGREYKSH